MTTQARAPRASAGVSSRTASGVAELARSLVSSSVIHLSATVGLFGLYELAAAALLWRGSHHK